MMKWTQKQFRMIQKIARRHDIHCLLRVAMVTGDDLNGTRVCNCNGKCNSWGEPKTTPKEKTLEDVFKQMEIFNLVKDSTETDEKKTK